MTTSHWRRVGMSGLRRRVRALLIVALLVGCSLAVHAPAWAQSGESWSFVITPQVWMSHIAKNGFAAAPVDATFAGAVFTPNGFDIENPITSSTSSSEAINPQWGIQVAAQKGR